MKIFLGLLALLPVLADAAYYNLTRDTKVPQQCITYDVRYPYWTKGIYIATYPGHSRSKEGWIAPYYGGIVSDKSGASQLIQYASWQMGGKGAPTSGIDFVHAGPHMSWQRSTWEGSSGGIKGKWPNAEFKPGVWYRFVHRVWTPATPTPHLGYAGVWMKNPDTGVWHHLATFKFPAELTGFNSMGGFTEFIHGGASNTVAVEFRNSYAMRDGRWGSEPEFSAFNHKEDTITLTPSPDNSSVTLETTRTPKNASGKHAVVPVVTQKLALAQPAEPNFFDEARVSEPSAEISGDRLVVKWKVDSIASPQLGYTVEILDGGTVVATAAENEPEARLCVVGLKKPATGPLTARIRITDIFGKTSAPATVAVARAEPLAAVVAPARSAPGLAYRYFESAKPGEWTAIPDFSALTPKREGVVPAPDITPRLSRTDYAFDFTGYLSVPADGLYAFNLTSACGAKLIVDGRTVIDADGYHSIAKATGTVALRAGLHKVRIPYYQGARQMLQPDDFLQLSWSGPGFADRVVPPESFRRETGKQEPVVVLRAQQQGSGGINLALAASVSAGDHKVERVEYYATNTGFDYYAMQGARGADYLLAESATPAKPVPGVIWAGAGRTLRARLVYDGNRTIDSAPVNIPDAPPAKPADDKAMRFTALEHHLYPAGFSRDGDTVTLVGESMGLLTKPFTGDGTLVARLADITPDKPMPDGTTPVDAQNWYAGIILRDNLNPRPGEPLGGAQIPFTAVMGSANRMTRHCDSTMINGAGNQPSGDVGGDHRWFKIERKGATFVSSISKDGKTWKTIKTVELPKMSDTLQAGFVIYAIPSATPRVHHARFDNISLGK